MCRFCGCHSHQKKLITIPLAIFFVKWLFPKDEKTKKELENIKIKKPNKEEH